ncbi:MAG: cytochrome b/b6 domain-containing protein [Acidiphilium sp.]|nr:cytochrome b/b6 domain-containing protein [Acidiphilium sp.]MDD4936700.1 cytochrome b/b6 domain-containing protein [Acidiphilium sp.]
MTIATGDAMHTAGTTQDDSVQPRFPLGFRIVHGLLIILVTFQLFSERYMKKIWKAHGHDEFRHLLFHAHMWSGMATALLLVVLWSLIARNRQLRGHLFPFDGPYVQNISPDIAGLAKGKFPPNGMRGGLPGLVHGLGLLVISGMAITGFLMFFLIPSFGVAAPAHIYQWPKKIHDYVGEFVWLFWWGHLGMAVLHRISGVRR